MTDLAWPQQFVPNTTSWQFLSNTAAFTSPLTGATRTAGRGGDRWAGSLMFTNLSGEARAILTSFLARLRGQANRVFLPEHAFKRRGSFPTGNVLPNTTFPDTQFWDSSDAAEVEIIADSRMLRATRVAVGNTRVIRPVSPFGFATVVSGRPYLFTVGALAGLGAPRYTLRLGTSSGGTEIVAGAIETTAKVAHVSGLSSGTDLYASIADVIGGGRAAGDYQLFSNPSVSRCMFVDGAAQTGASLRVDGLTPSTDGLLLAGEFVSVYTAAGWELKQLVHSLRSGSGGVGHLVFEPQLRASPADNAPVAVHAAFGRFLLAENAVAWSNQPGGFSSLAVDLVEDIAL